MDDILANLTTEGSMFEDGILASSFDLESTFMTSPPATAVYPSDVPPHMRAQQSDLDYLSVEDKPLPSKPSTPTPPMQPKPEHSQTIAETSQQPEQQPQSPQSQNPVDADRRRLRPLADSIISQSWRLRRSPPDFVASLRRKFPPNGSLSVMEDSSDEPNIQTMTVVPKPESSTNDDDFEEQMWGLQPAVEGAVLDALFSRLVNSEATSVCLMSYLSYLLLAGVVSQRSVLSAYLTWTSNTPNVTDRVMRSFSEFLADVIPNYSFSTAGDELTTEVKQLLNTFISVVRSTAKSPKIAPRLAQMLSHERTIAVIRACLRRVPELLEALHAAVAELDVEPPSNSEMAGRFEQHSAYSEAVELKGLVEQLERGLCVGITTLENIATSLDIVSNAGNTESLASALQTAYAVSVQVFGSEVGKALRDLWSQQENAGGDFGTLTTLERATRPGSPSQAPKTKYMFKRKVRACEAIVRFMVEKSSKGGASEMWRGVWGGKQRLKRIIRDALPQVRNEISTETGALIVAMAVICCADMCLGKALRLSEKNDGKENFEGEEKKEREDAYEEVEESIGELTSFAVNSLEAAATAEESPVWRSFGLWLLLLMSRSGCMLRATGCDHARAAKVLRAWGGLPSGTGGSHVPQGTSGQKQSSQSGSGNQGHGSGSGNSEGVGMFSGCAAVAIIDSSDVCGGDETLKALCEDLVQ